MRRCAHVDGNAGGGGGGGGSIYGRNGRICDFVNFLCLWLDSLCKSLNVAPIQKDPAASYTISMTATAQWSRCIKIHIRVPTVKQIVILHYAASASQQSKHQYILSFEQTDLDSKCLCL